MMSTVLHFPNHVLCSFLLILSACSFIEVSAKLQYVQILFRHGDRAPIDLYPTDPNKDHKWPGGGLSMLTPFGMKQHYAHGKFLRKMYEDFITTDPTEINVTSSQVDRCLKSAETNLASFYAPYNQWKFENDVDWQPISIHYVPESIDRYLETGSKCPKAEQEVKNVINSPGGQKIVKDNWEMFTNLTISSGKDIHAWKTASYLFDVLMIEKKYNLITPGWAEAWWNQLERVHILSFFWNFNSPILLRLRAGPILGLIIERMEKKIYDKSFGGKVQIYSGHDSNIAVILHALNLYNMVPPPYCSTLLFELHEMEDGNHAVRLLYLNSSTPETGNQEPHILVLAGCKEFCPIEFFKTNTKHLIPDNWEKECGLTAPKDPCFIAKNFVIGLGVALALVSILVMYQSAKLRRRDQNERSYHLLPNSALAL